MATISDIINKGVCGNTFAGFNLNKGCSVSFKDVKEIWRTPVGFEFDSAIDFDEDYIKSLQLSGDLTIIKRIKDFPEAGTEALTETLADNTEIGAGDAKYKYTPMWAEDIWLNVQLGKLEGQNNNRFLFIDSAGNILGTQGSNEDVIKGFLTSRTHRSKLILQSSGVGAKQGLEFQLANTYEIEDYPVVLSNENLDFDPRLIESIIPAYVSFTATPADTGTQLEFSLVNDRGRKGVISGATDSGFFNVYVNGVLETAVSASEVTDGNYTIAVTALSTGDKVSIEINGVKEVSGDGLYVSNTASTLTL